MQLAQPIGFTWICMSRAYLDFNVFVKWNLIRDRKHTSAIGLKYYFAWVYFILNIVELNLKPTQACLPRLALQQTSHWHDQGKLSTILTRKSQKNILAWTLRSNHNHE